MVLCYSSCASFTMFTLSTLTSGVNSDADECNERHMDLKSVQHLITVKTLVSETIYEFSLGLNKNVVLQAARVGIALECINSIWKHKIKSMK